MTDDKKDEEIIKLKKKIEELENKPKINLKNLFFFSIYNNFTFNDFIIIFKQQ